MECAWLTMTKTCFDPGDGCWKPRTSSLRATLAPKNSWQTGVRGITLGQVATEEKSNGITALPQLLDIIDVEAAIATIDAAGCQKNIAYLSSLRRNGKQFANAVRNP